MKSIERRFNNIIKNNPCWSLYICFSEAIKEQKFSKRIIYNWFTKLVNENDYDKKDKRIILHHLTDLSSNKILAEESRKKG